VINSNKTWKKIVQSEGKDGQLISNLRTELVKNPETSKLFVILEYVDQLSKGDKSIRILDYGCGSGQLLIYLRILGYKNLTGVDVRNQEAIDRTNMIYSNMGFGSNIFFTYDGITLPFKDCSFDIILSQQVLEHVHNVEQYFLESRRVLSYKGRMLLEFPHRLVPYDTHTRMWFVHYFPQIIRNVIYDKFRDNGAKHYNKLLNLHSMRYYNFFLNAIFLSTEDVTSYRLGSFAYKDYYEGNMHVRILADKLINFPFIGRIITKTLSIFASATLIVYK
jgi:SAM-dependent methyltransferase